MNTHLSMAKIASIMFIILGISYCSIAEIDSVSMGVSYANDVYYSFEQGEVSSVDKSNWDIAFYTNIMSAGVISNDGRGIEVVQYPNGDLTAWDNIDTTGLSSWPVLYNSEEYWEEGSFNRHSSGDFDYGWGIYNMITHEVVGDSIFLIKFPEDVVKKFMIVKKISAQNKYVIRYANLDNTDDKTLELDCNPFTDQNFAYFSFDTETLFSREPAKTEWDILFTQYVAIQPNGSPYIVTGAINNVGVYANKFTEVNPSFSDWSSVQFGESRTAIGYDWKYFDMDLFSYVVEDSTVFFVQNLSQDIYKLIFTKFSGSFGGGKIIFDKEMVSGTGFNDISSNDIDLNIFPNPAKDFIKIVIPEDFSNNSNLYVFDISGKQVLHRQLSESSQNEIITIQTNSLHNGSYFMRLEGKKNSYNKVFIVQ